MTYYGRWTYKYEIASEKGAAAAIIIHDRPRGLPLRRGKQQLAGAVRRHFSRRGKAGADRGVGRARQGEGIVADAGQNFDSLKASAATKQFKPVPLNATATFDVKIDVREDSVAQRRRQIPGTDKKDEYVVYSAHWDHLGRHDAQGRPDLQRRDGQRRSSALIEIAKAFTKLPTPPRRSILFLSVTAEEEGAGRIQVLRDPSPVSAPTRPPTSTSTA